MKNAVLFLILLAFLGCTKEVSLQYDGHARSKIVLHGLISPQEGVDLTISRTIPSQEKLDTNTLFLNDALAILYQDNQEFDTLVNVGDKGHFQLSQNKIIDAGKTYVLRVFVQGMETASVDLDIPDSISNLTGAYAELPNGDGSLSIGFDDPLSPVYYAEVIGYDSLGAERQIFPTGGSDGQCIDSWIYSQYFFHADCLGPENPRIVGAFDRETIIWEPRQTVLLHKIKFRLSKIEPKYETIVIFDDQEEVGFTEPELTQTNIKGGYGYVLPVNFAEVVVVF